MSHLIVTLSATEIVDLLGVAIYILFTLALCVLIGWPRRRK